jgi:hypothetical protein
MREFAMLWRDMRYLGVGCNRLRLAPGSGVRNGSKADIAFSPVGALMRA